MNIVESAEGFAEWAHQGQEYGMGKEFIIHPRTTAGVAEMIGYSDDVIAGCYLHDVIEDTDVTADDLRAIYPGIIVDAVEAVTYTDLDKLNGVDKIDKAKLSPLSHAIKFCDSSANLYSTIRYGVPSDKDRFDLFVRYTEYLEKLAKGLPKPEEVTTWIRENDY